MEGKAETHWWHTHLRVCVCVYVQVFVCVCLRARVCARTSVCPFDGDRHVLLSSPECKRALVSWHVTGQSLSPFFTLFRSHCFHSKSLRSWNEMLNCSSKLTKIPFGFDVFHWVSNCKKMKCSFALVLQVSDSYFFCTQNCTRIAGTFSSWKSLLLFFKKGIKTKDLMKLTTRLLYFVTLVSFISPRFRCEEILKHVKWREKVIDPKYWYQYVRKSLEKIAEQASCTTTLASSKNVAAKRFRCHLRYFTKVMNEQFECEKVSNQMIKSMVFWQTEIKLAPTTYIHKSVTHPTKLSKIYSPKGIYCAVSYFVETNYKITFEIHRRLNLNVTFLRLEVKEVFGSCDLHNVTVESFLNWSLIRSFAFCGVISSFSLYPPKHNVSVTIGLYFEIPTHVEFLFSVISEHIIETQHPTFTLSGNKHKHISSHHIHASSQVINTFKIQHPKYNSISIRLKEPKNNKNNRTTLWVFHGPGILSERMEISNNHSQAFVSTFQCLVQVISDPAGINGFHSVSHKAIRNKFTSLVPGKDQCRHISFVPSKRCTDHQKDRHTPSLRLMFG